MSSYKLFYIQPDNAECFTHSGWKYRKSITLTSNTTIANYQIKIELNTSNFDYSKANVNGNDLRFYQVDETSLNYWIQTWNTGGTSIIWVKVATIGTNFIYMYYGNSSASAVSNGENTFPFFDDFSTNLNKWTITGTGSIVNGQLKLTANTTAYGNVTFNTGIIEGYYSGNAISNYQYISIGFESNSSHYTYVRGIYSNGYKTMASWNVGAGGSDYNGGTNSKSGYIKVVRSGIITNFYQKTQLTDNWTTVKENVSDTMTGLYPSLTIYQSGYIAYFDNIFVREYMSIEPTITLTNEEILPNDIIEYTIDFKLERELEKLLDKLTLKISRRIDNISTFTEFEPNTEIYLTFNDIGIFRGRVKTSDKKQFYEIDVFSSAEILSRTVVQEIYPNDIIPIATPENIFTNLISEYTDLMPIVSVSGTTFEKFLANDHLDAIIKKLCDALGWYCYTTSDKNIYFKSRGATTNSTVIRRQSTNSNAIFDKWKKEYNELVNYIQVTGDNIDYSTQELFTGDTSSKIFTLLERPSTVKVIVDGTERLLDSYTIESDMKQIIFNDAPISSATANINITYNYAYPIFASRENSVSIEQYGQFSKCVTNKWLKTHSDATNYANNYLEMYKDPLLYNNILMNASYITTFTPGEKVRIIDDIESIDDYYVINKIKLEYLTGRVELNVGDYFNEFIGVQRVLQSRITELEKEDLRLILQMNTNQDETLIPTETLNPSSTQYLNLKVHDTYPPKCNEGRGSLNDARVELCQCT